MTAATAVAPTRPYRWGPVRGFNVIARNLPRLAPPIGSIDELHAAATRATGLTDFGDTHYLEGLGVFVAALAEEADLTPAGRVFARGAVVASLSNRLLVQAEVTAEPGIVVDDPGPAIVVLGLPRSGTTLLQNLLALDPANRSLRQWEASRPAPPPQIGAEDNDPRVKAAERATWLLDRIAPRARVLHPTGPRLPTECVTLFANSFASLELGSIYQVPGYTAWCLATDMRPHYAYYRRQLQLLAWHDRRERWVLKSPAHLFWIDELSRTLPGASIVQLHRDPTEVLGSFCSLVSVLAATNTSRIDHAGIGREWSRHWCDAVGRAERARADLAPGRLVDVRYTDLVADPVAVIEALYGAFGHPFTGAFADALRAQVATDARTRAGQTHRYDLATFGLDADVERERFAEAGRARWQ